jgi:hypothetical protein
MTSDRVIALACIAIGLLISLSSVSLGLGAIDKPEAGLFPFFVGLCVILLAITLFFNAERRKGPILGLHWTNVVLVLGSLAFYGLGLTFLGFPIMTIVFMVFVMKVIEPQKWSVVIAVSVIATGFSYLLFSVWLGVAFPIGILGR